MDSTGLMHAIRRHARLVVVVLAAGLLLAVAFAALLPRSYTARATLFLRVQAASTSLYERSQFGLQRIQSYPELLDSPSLLRTVIAEVGLDESPQQLVKHLSADNPASTVLLNVTATAPSAQQAADIANAAADALASNVNELENSETTSKNAVMLVPQITAQAPGAPTLPNVPAIVGLGVVGGLVAGLLAALAVERFRPRIRTAADVRRVTGLPLIAQLPAPKRKGADLADDSAALIAAANLRTLGRGRIAPVLLLVPAGEIAARPSVRHQLARGLVRTGRHVVLIETAASGSTTAAAGTPGLAELLAGVARADDVMQRPEPGMDLVAAGDPSVIPPSFALETAFASAVTPIVADHDVAVLETSPTDAVIDLAIAGPFARTAVIVASRRRSTEHEVRRTLAALRALEIMPMGVVLTDGPAIDTIDLVTSWEDSDFVRIEIDEFVRRDSILSGAGARQVDVLSDADAGAADAGNSRSKR